MNSESGDQSDTNVKDQLVQIILTDHHKDLMINGD